ncbi:Pkinase-domain-containing protein [Serendipita vermifera]|nr:Pkinase-domain-containing protein [Serendipita vermifera]
MAESSNPTRRARHSRREDPKMIGSWKLGKTIGKGSSGRVRIARHVRTGDYAAVKIVSKHALITSRMSMAGISEQADKILLGIEREIVLMKLIDHPNILSLYDVWETSNELYLILEYVPNGELFDHLVAKGRLSVQEALQHFQQIISAVDYCHRFNIAHRDLKPENLLLDSDNNIKVADFGMAAWEGVGMLETSCGSPHYASPEVVQGIAYKGCTSDIWSCGVILYALLVGRLPFDDDNIRRLLEKVKRGAFIMPNDIPLAAQDLLARMLEKDVDKRITMKDILVHPWFTSRPPKPIQGKVLEPPSLDAVYRPVKSPAEVDPDILANLRTLWHGAPEEQILESLLNDQNTWEKALYHLLVQYRAKRLENYTQEEEPVSNKRHPKAPSIPHVNQEEKTQPLVSSDVWNDAQSIPDLESNKLERAERRPTGPRNHSPRPIVPEPIAPKEAFKTIKLVETLPKANGPRLPDSPRLPPIPVSTTGDNTMTNLLAQISGFASSTQRPPKLDQELPPLPNVIDDEDDRFADAEEDETHITECTPIGDRVTPAQCGVNKSPNDSSSRLPGVGLGISAATRPRHTTYIRSNHPSLDVKRRPFSLRSPRASNNQGNSNLWEVSPSRASPLTAQPMNRRSGTSFDKENTSMSSSNASRSTSGTVDTKATSTSSNNRVEKKRSAADKHVKILLPGDATNMKCKFNQSSVSVISENLSGFFSSAPSPEKTTWFSNLFKFKPASFYLLSVYDGLSSRDECKRLLAAMGVSVSIENSGHLLCQFDGVHDPSGVMGAIKPVKFRVEVHGVLHSHAIAGYVTSLSIIQDKGALSTFKLLYNRLRREWNLDTPVPILKTSQQNNLVRGGTGSPTYGFVIPA